MTRRALREIAASKKRPLYTTPLSGNDVFLVEFARAEARYRAARAFAMEVFTAAQAAAREDGGVPSLLLGRIRQATTWAHEEARAVLDFCHAWAGSDGFREPSALGRCLRDTRVAVTHIFVDPITMVDAGKALIADLNGHAE